MINATQLAALSPQKRAQVIYAEAQSQLSTRLWRAALGDGEGKDNRDTSPFSPNNMKMDSLLGLLGGREGVAEYAGALRLPLRVQLPPADRRQRERRECRPTHWHYGRRQDRSRRTAHLRACGPHVGHQQHRGER